MAAERRKPAAEKMPPGKPRHVPTQKDRDLVSFASAIGGQQTSIARLIGINAETLRKHYRDELDLGMERANISVARNLYQIATGTSPQAAPAAMFWMKTRAGWKETVRQENTGLDGGPIKTEAKIIFSGVLAEADKNV